MPKRKVILLISVFLLISVLFSSCAGPHDLDDRVREASNPYRFHLLAWEIKTLAGEPVKIINRHAADNATPRKTVETGGGNILRQGFTIRWTGSSH
jgi:hypothetical protein